MSGEWDEQQKIGRSMEDPLRQQRPEMDKRNCVLYFKTLPALRKRGVKHEKIARACLYLIHPELRLLFCPPVGTTVVLIYLFRNMMVICRFTTYFL